MGEFEVGDKVKRIHDSHQGMGVGDIGTIEDIKSGGDTIDLEEFGDGHAAHNLELFEKAPSKNVYKMKKTIYHVLVVNKKTGKEMKNVTISADNEQQAILKTFGVDAENTFIKVTEEGSYEEDKPLKAVLEKKE